MKRRLLLALPLSLVIPRLESATDQNVRSARRKFQIIESERAKPGTRVFLTKDELRAYLSRDLAPTLAEHGVRQPKVDTSSGVALAAANIDFLMLREASNRNSEKAAPPPGFIMRQLFEGERYVEIDATVRSANGFATVDVKRVSVGGVPLSGRALDFLMKSYIQTRYPDVTLGKPFELGYRIDRLDFRPDGVEVLIGR